MGWWIALAVLVGLAILPLGVRVRYMDEEPSLAVLAGPIPIQLYPQRKKKAKPSQKETVPVEKEPSHQQPEQEPKPTPPKAPDTEPKPTEPKEIQVPPTTPPKKGMEVKDLLEYLPMVLDFLGEFRRKLRVNRLELRLILAGSDPCDLAVNYGKAWAAVGNLMPLLERAFVIQKRDVEVECDFTASKTTVMGRMDLTITLGRLLAVAVKFALRALKVYLNMKKRKGGAVQ